MKVSFSVISALALGLALGACSTPSLESLAQNDPWETTNRDIFDFDVRVDHAVARPIAKGYRAVVPEFGPRRHSQFPNQPEFAGDPGQ